MPWIPPEWKTYCASHRIHEEVLDEAVLGLHRKAAGTIRSRAEKVTQLQKQWALEETNLDAHCLALQKEILRLEQEIDELEVEKLNGDGGSSAHVKSVLEHRKSIVSKQNRGPASAATILNEERPLLSRRAPRAVAA